VETLQRLAYTYQLNAHLRGRVGMDVSVGDHTPPAGGRHVPKALRALLKEINTLSPYEFHVRYETLHPFMDGNGRTGRALWAWQMTSLYGDRWLALGFLHRFYYQTLSACQLRSN